MKRERWIRICPQCDSKEVTNRGMISRDALSPNYVCLTCGFQGPLFPEVSPKEAKKLEEKPRKFIPSRLPVLAEKYEKPNRPAVAILIGFLVMLVALLLLLWFG
ncbi:MAG: hypothetical protein HYX24_02080 [Candidatus Aenigmarchaeota archaeon]|nr:hypothetical protein [Candidatus Aenigmarchaeota archaeon]